MRDREEEGNRRVQPGKVGYFPGKSGQEQTPGGLDKRPQQARCGTCAVVWGLGVDGWGYVWTLTTHQL